MNLRFGEVLVTWRRQWSWDVGPAKASALSQVLSLSRLMQQPPVLEDKTLLKAHHFSHSGCFRISQLGNISKNVYLCKAILSCLGVTMIFARSIQSTCKTNSRSTKLNAHLSKNLSPRSSQPPGFVQLSCEHFELPGRDQRNRGTLENQNLSKQI